MTILDRSGPGVPVGGEQLMRLFKQHDKNGDGLLDKNELKQAFKRLGALVPGWRATRGLLHADADGDGFISPAEMTVLVKYAEKSGYTVK